MLQYEKTIIVISLFIFIRSFYTPNLIDILVFLLPYSNVSQEECVRDTACIFQFIERAELFSCLMDILFSPFHSITKRVSDLKKRSDKTFL